MRTCSSENRIRRVRMLEPSNKSIIIIIMRQIICPSVRHLIWGKNRLRDENGKGTMGCGSGMGLWRGLLRGCLGKGKGRRKNMFGRDMSILSLIHI